MTDRAGEGNREQREQILSAGNNWPRRLCLIRAPGFERRIQVVWRQRKEARFHLMKRAVGVHVFERLLSVRRTGSSQSGERSLITGCLFAWTEASYKRYEKDDYREDDSFLMY